jgi:hypothetical protein
MCKGALGGVEICFVLETDDVELEIGRV